MAGSTDAPYPPLDLATRVLELPSGDAAAYAYAFYEEQGAETRAELLRLLPDGTDLSGKRLLDFGSGAGRTLRHFLAEAATGEAWGVDIDPRSIDWLKANLSPPINAAVCGVDPPLDFESDYFDFAWAISVFTHLSGNSADWLLELHRVLKPGGFLMASYMGELNSEAIAGEPWDDARVGMNELWHRRPWDQGGPMVLMSDWWVREHWGRAFDVVGSSPGFHNQSWVMLRKKDVRLSSEELLRPGEDPREWTALRHNIAQLQREIDDLSEWIPTEVDRVVREFENSLSFRITRPLRAIGRAARRAGTRRDR